MKGENGVVISDITISIVIIVLFASLISGLIFNVWFSNFRAQRDGMAVVYLSQQLESIAIDDYDNITNQTINIAADNNNSSTSGYTIKQEILEEKKNANEKGIKRVKETISYNIGSKKSEKSLERFKVEE